jgi:ABC-type methionine transport system ATPase subunit
MNRLLALQNVHVHYRRGLVALRVLVDVSLEISAGEVVSVLVRRGQGKSTLLRVAAGIQRPAEGKVLVDGNDLWRLDNAQRQRLRERIGWVQAIAPAVDVRVLEHVATPLRETCGKHESYVRASAALERVGASECAAQWWEGLSDRERALVAVAGALARGPRLLVADDLTCALGLVEASEVASLMRSLAHESGVGVLLGVSDASEMQCSDRITVLGGGRLQVPIDARAESERGIDFPGRGGGNGEAE